MYLAIGIGIIFLILAVGLYLFLHAMLDQDRKTAETVTPPRPEWASFFSPSEWEAFIREVRRYFKAKGVAYTLDGGTVHVNDGSQHYGLGNLAQICRQLKRAEWSAFIEAHFAIIERSEQEGQDLELKIGDFMQVKGLLKVRLAPDDFDISGVATISRVDLPGTVSFLAFDLPSTVRSVKPDEAKVWGQSDETLFAIGLDNLYHDAAPTITHQELKDGLEAVVFSGESFFIASHALLLDRYPECLGKAGALVVTPHRHCLIAYPIEDRAVDKVIDVMGYLALSMEHEGPGSISPRLYWYHDGQYLDLPFKVTRDAFQFFPPDEFTQMLNTLAAQ